MRYRCFVLLLSVLLANIGASARPGSGQAPVPEGVLGIWSGTWDGSGSGGGFELTLEREKDAPVSGKVAVTGEPEYTATLKSISFEGRKMTATYDFPPDEQGQVVLVATFEGDRATGTWSLQEKASGSEVATGGWKVTKKAR